MISRMFRPRVITFFSAKGGNGKDLIGRHLSSYYSSGDQEKNLPAKKVLYVDLDPQNQSADVQDLAMDTESDEYYNHPSIAHAIISDNAREVMSNITKIRPNLYHIPPSFELLALSSVGRHSLDKVMQQAYDYFDIVIINTQAGWNNLTAAAIETSDVIVTPVEQSSKQARESVWWAHRLINDTIPEALDRWHLLLNMVQPGELAVDNERKLREKHGERRILSTTIPRTEQFRKFEHTGEKLTSAARWGKAYPTIQTLAAELESIAKFNQFSFMQRHGNKLTLEQKEELDAKFVTRDLVTA